MNHSVNYSGFADIVNSMNKLSTDVKRESETGGFSEADRSGEEVSVSQAVANSHVLTRN